MSAPIVFTVRYRDGTSEQSSYGVRTWVAIDPSELLRTFFGQVSSTWSLGYKNSYLKQYPRLSEIVEIEYQGKIFEVDMPGLIAHLDNWVATHDCPANCNHDWYDVGTTQGEVITGRRCSKCERQEWY